MSTNRCRPITSRGEAPSGYLHDLPSRVNSFLILSSALVIMAVYRHHWTQSPAPMMTWQGLIFVKQRACVANITVFILEHVLSSDLRNRINRTVEKTNTLWAHVDSKDLGVDETPLETHLYRGSKNIASLFDHMSVLRSTHDTMRRDLQLRLRRLLIRTQIRIDNLQYDALS